MLLGFFSKSFGIYLGERENRGVPDVSPQVPLTLRWMPRCSALEAAHITEKMNDFISLQA